MKLGLIALVGLAGCGGAQLTTSETALIAAEQAQSLQCVAQYAPDASAQDACRASVKATWDTYWLTQFDGGAQ